MPKALLRVQGKPIIDYIIDQVGTVKEIDGICVVSNHKFADHFARWAKASTARVPLRVLDDGSSTEDDRLGAIGDMLFAIEAEHIDDEAVIIAGDNLFTFSLAKYFSFYRSKMGDCVCVKRINDREALKSLGVATLDASGRVVELAEKPREPKSDCAVFATYMYKRDTLPLISKYLSEGGKKDAPGYLVEWLCSQRPVYAYIMDGECYDIGTPAAYRQAQSLDLNTAAV
jgi:glucose-1-phosphate thymidylyltransferase